ncbi:MAG: FMN-binding protein, partial [Prevotella sp.]|nr:FMN-binding protein [Prevotella sp.]
VQQVDAVTGATFSSEAVVKNVQLALDYYQKNK